MWRIYRMPSYLGTDEESMLDISIGWDIVYIRLSTLDGEASIGIDLETAQEIADAITRKSMDKDR
jgi:uncharacterized metal-binding protein